MLKRQPSTLQQLSLQLQPPSRRHRQRLMRNSLPHLQEWRERCLLGTVVLSRGSQRISCRLWAALGRRRRTRGSLQPAARLSRWPQLECSQSLGRACCPHMAGLCGQCPFSACCLCAQVSPAEVKVASLQLLEGPARCVLGIACRAACCMSP